LNNLPQVTNKETRLKQAADRNAIQGDYKTWKDSLSYKDLVKWLETCYNEYNQWGGDLSLPRETRNSYLDRAFFAKQTKDYIERQA
jgi:hypothetical protein